MSRIAATFAALAERGRKALIPYITAGDPHADTTPQIMRAMVEAGADVIELGVPFSDPMADGPVIQKASERALARRIGLVDVLAMVREFRGRDRETPVVLMGYANPIERYGVERFVADAQGRGRRRRPRRRLPARGVRRLRARSCARRGHRSDLPDRADLERRAHRQRRRSGQRIRLPCLAEGRHRCRPLRHRCRQGHDSANQGAREAAGRRRLRHPRRRRRRGRWPTSPMRSSSAARWCSCSKAPSATRRRGVAGRFIAGIRAALDA